MENLELDLGAELRYFWKVRAKTAMDAARQKKSGAEIGRAHQVRGHLDVTVWASIPRAPLRRKALKDL